MAKLTGKAKKDFLARMAKGRKEAEKKRKKRTKSVKKSVRNIKRSAKRIKKQMRKTDRLAKTELNRLKNAQNRGMSIGERKLFETLLLQLNDPSVKEITIKKDKPKRKRR